MAIQPQLRIYPLFPQALNNLNVLISDLPSDEEKLLAALLLLPLQHLYFGLSAALKEDFRVMSRYFLLLSLLRYNELAHVQVRLLLHPVLHDHVLLLLNSVAHLRHALILQHLQLDTPLGLLLLTLENFHSILQDLNFGLRRLSQHSLSQHFNTFID